MFERCELEGKKSIFKAAVFLCGSPPLSGDGKSLLLADVLDPASVASAYLSCDRIE